MDHQLHLYHPSTLERVNNPETIETLHLYDIDLSTTAPDVLHRFEQLRYLHIHAFRQNYQLSPAIFHFKQLKGLFLAHVDWSPLNRSLDQLAQLTILSIQTDALQGLPEALIQMQTLEELELRFSRVSQTMPHWHLLEYLPALRYLSLSHISPTQFPHDNITELDALQALHLSKNNLKKLTKQHPKFVKTIPYCFGHSSLETKYFKKLLPKMRHEALPWEQRIIWFNLLANHTAKLDQLATKKQILAATDIQPATFSAIRLHALNYYQQRWGQTHHLTSGAHLTVLGTIATKKNILRSQLKALDIQYSPKITEKTTHVLMGQRSQGAYQQALAQHLPILTESQVLDYVNTHTEQYLVDEQDEQPEQLEHLRALLTSGQDDNIALALSLFEQGGFPMPLLTALFYAYLEIQRPPLREQVRRLLRQYGSTGLFEVLKSRWMIFQPYTSENAIRTKLKKLERTTQLDVLELARYGYAHHRQGVAYLLEKLPVEEALTILADQTNTEGVLQLANLGFSSVPPNVYQAKQVHTIDFSRNNSLRTIPVKQLATMPLLKQLILRRTFYLKTNDKWRTAMAATLPQVTLIF